MLHPSAGAQAYFITEGEDIAFREEVARCSSKYNVPSTAPLPASATPVWGEGKLRAGKQLIVVLCALCVGLLACIASKLTVSSEKYMHTYVRTTMRYSLALFLR